MAGGMQWEGGGALLREQCWWRRGDVVGFSAEYWGSGVGSSGRVAKGVSRSINEGPRTGGNTVCGTACRLHTVFRSLPRPGISQYPTGGRLHNTGSLARTAGATQPTTHITPPHACYIE